MAIVADQTGALYLLEVTVEETAEMAGVLLALAGLLSLLMAGPSAARSPRLRESVRSGAPPGP